MHLHILGICGTFMAGIAALAREAGHRVTGSDANAWPPMSTQLEDIGIQIQSGYAPEHLRPAPDLVIVGNVISRGNSAMEYVLDEGLPYISGPQWLAENVLRERYVLAVSGTHGKTTTTSMLAWILQQAGLNPGFLIGGVAQDFGISARLGGGHYFVIEADEYDTAFFDKRSKFVHYCPNTVILNNLEYDHADIFPNLAAIERQFHHLLRTVPSSGFVVHNAQERALRAVLKQGCWSQKVAFHDQREWHLQGNEVFYGQRHHGTLALIQPGQHNLSNALAATVAASSIGIPPSGCLSALASFKGVRRRLELLDTIDNIRVYDDFAHHPTAIAATIAALKAQSSGRVIAILEPRSNSMRQGAHAAALPESLEAADLALIYAAPTLQWDAKTTLSPLSRPWLVFSDLEALVDEACAQAAPGDCLLIMSNGDFGGLHNKLLIRLSNGVS